MPKDPIETTVDILSDDRESVARSIGRTIASGGKEGILFAGLLVSLTCALFLVLAYFMWLKWVPQLWSWGFSDPGIHTAVAVIGLIYLAIIPFMTIFIFPNGLAFWNEYQSAQKELGETREKQTQLQDQLDVNDPQYPVKLVSYSRFMLKEYYIMAMKQAQRSFKYCLIAMWLGFAVLLVGVADYFMPMQSILASTLNFETTRDTAFSAQSFVLITGVVLEFISVAFLWVYRFSIKQQTYYYRRQLKLHNVLIAKNVTESMETGKDAALTTIITNLLENVEMTQLEPPSTSALKGLAPSS